MAKIGREFWIQIAYEDNTPDTWISWLNSYERAISFAGNKMARDPNIAFILILDGSVKKGEIARKNQILADFNRQKRAGSRKFSTSKGFS